MRLYSKCTFLTQDTDWGTILDWEIIGLPIENA